MRTFSKRWGRDIYTIGPGGVYLAQPGELVATLLGSCVSACIRDTKLGIGGMNHVMVPLERPDDRANARLVATAYGAYAMEVLINELLKAGAQRSQLEVKIFGGGRMLRGMTDIGSRNIDFVRHYLHVEGLKLVGEDVGGNAPRKILFAPDSGRVKVRRLTTSMNRVVEEETKVPEVPAATEAGSVELF